MDGHLWNRRRTDRRAAKGPALTAREREVVQRIAEGDTTGVIAEQLFISPTTVETHVRKAMARLGAKNRPHLIALALDAGEI
jgi:DNA-binding CsgD family transcriptional regulator